MKLLEIYRRKEAVDRRGRYKVRVIDYGWQDGLRGYVVEVWGPRARTGAVEFISERDARKWEVVE